MAERRPIPELMHGLADRVKPSPADVPDLHTVKARARLLRGLNAGDHLGRCGPLAVRDEHDVCLLPGVLLEATSEAGSASRPAAV